MTELLKPDICVIGAGAGGLTVAGAAAAFGVPVVLIESGKLGGDCLNVGCVPSKSLIAAAMRARCIADAAKFGIRVPEFGIDYARVHDHVQGVIASIAPNDSKERFTGLGVRVIQGIGRFKDKKTVAVGDAFEIKARRFVIASGSSPALPQIAGLESTPHFTNETIFGLAECPRHLIVIGAGSTGLELGQAFRRLGAEVTILETGAPLAREDPECARIVLEQINREGVTVRSGASILRVQPAENGIAVILSIDGGEHALVGTHLLIAAGRRPNTDDLGLDAAGVGYGPGGIVVNKGLRTTNRRVYAIGDVAGGPQFTHAANHHAGLVIRNALFRLPVKSRDDLIPRVTFTDPELAQAGLTELAARQCGYKSIRVLRWPFHENDRAQAERETAGHIKVVTDRRGRILGVTIVGTSAGELIAPWILAISNGLNIRALAEIVVPYPTLAEIGKMAAISYFRPRLTSPFVRRVIKLLRHLG